MMCVERSRKIVSAGATGLLFVQILLHAASAHDQIPGSPQSGPIALVGGTVHVVDGDSIVDGIIVFDEGKITAVGKKVALPKGCETRDVTGKHVYPGLMESMSNIGLAEVNAVRSTIDTDEIGNDNGNLRPWVAVNADSEWIPVARAGGVLLASIAPKRGNIRGQSAVIQLDGWTYKDMLVSGDTGLVVAWRNYDSRKDDDAERAKERDERLTALADRLDAASRYAIARTARPGEVSIDLRLEALLPVINGETPMIVDADTRREIEAAIAFCVARGVRPIIYGGYDAPQCAELLKKYDVPIVVHSTYRLPMRRHEPYDHPYTLPQRLHALGIPFCDRLVPGRAVLAEGRPLETCPITPPSPSRTGCPTTKPFAPSRCHPQKSWESMTEWVRSPLARMRR